MTIIDILNYIMICITVSVSTRDVRDVINLLIKSCQCLLWSDPWITRDWESCDEHTF